MADKKSGGVIIARSSGVFLTPPGLLGWSHLTDYDEFQPADGPVQRKFDVNHHYKEEAAEALGRRLGDHVNYTLMPLFLRAAEKAGQKDQAIKVKGKIEHHPWVAPSGQEWVDAHLQPFKEGDSIELPFMKYSNAAFYTDKSGNQKLKIIRATDKDNHTLDLKTLKLGRKSVIQVMLTPSLFSSAGINNGALTISLKLQGIRVLVLEQYGPSGPALGDLTEEDQALMGDGVEAQDLGAYVGQPKVIKTEDPEGLTDEEMPF